MVDTPIPDRFEIGSSKDLVGGVIFGVEFLISARKTDAWGNGFFWGSDEAPNGREW